MQQSRTITRKSASNLALAFVLLPKAKRDGMSALYAFCREVDDVADDESVSVEERRADIARACGAALPGRAVGPRETPLFRVNQELQPFISGHHLRYELFDELIRG